MKESREQRSAHVICVGNQKGGVGKTTNCIHLAAALTERGKTCLIIDLDMTAGATKSLRAPTHGWHDSFDLLVGAETATDTVIDDKDPELHLPPNIHLVPGSARLRELEQYLNKHEWIVHQDMLLEPIRQLRRRYDYIFLDTPPQSTKTTIPALKAADFVILSAMPDRLAMEALTEACQQIITAQDGPHPDLLLLGILVCSIPRPRTRLARALIKNLDQSGEISEGVPLKFNIEIMRTVVLQEATHAGQTIFQYDSSHEVAQHYRALADEVEERIALLTGERARMDAGNMHAVDKPEEKTANG